MSKSKEIFFKKDLPTVMENIAKANQDWLDEILAKIAIEKTESFDKVKVKIVGKAEAKAAIRAKLAEERIDEMKTIKQEYLLDNSYQSVVIYATNRIAELEAGLKGDKWIK